MINLFSHGKHFSLSESVWSFIHTSFLLKSVLVIPFVHMNTASLIDNGYLQAFFSANTAAQASRKSSPRVTNEAVQKAVSTLVNSFNDLCLPSNFISETSFTYPKLAVLALSGCCFEGL